MLKYLFSTRWVTRFGFAMLALLILGGAGMLWYFATRTQPTHALRIATGRITKPPNLMTQYLLRHGPTFRLQLDLHDVAGSEDSLHRVETGELDVALVKGGIPLEDNSRVRQVTAMDVECMHLLVKEPLAAAVTADYLALRGKTINLNKPATGTHRWTIDVLRFLGLRPSSPEQTGDFTPTLLDYPDMLRQADAVQAAMGEEREKLLAALPDAIFVAAPLPSPIVRKLVVQAQYRLVPLKFAVAYNLQRQAEPAQPDGLDRTAFIEIAIIPPYTYGAAPPVPDEPVTTLGMRRLVIANADVSGTAIVQLLHLIHNGPRDGSISPPDFDAVHFEYGQHPGVGLFQSERNQVMQKTVTRALEKLGGLAGAITGIVIGLIGYFKWRKLLRYEYYFREVARIDHVARGLEPPPPEAREPHLLLRHLQHRLAELRHEAITEFTDGHFQGENLMLGILTLIASTEECLPRLLAAPATTGAEFKPTENGNSVGRAIAAST